jgi:DNA-binding NarL/FixJ family response regulator
MPAQLIEKMTGSKKPFKPARGSETNPARLLICDDQKLIRGRIREMLHDMQTIRIVGEAANGRAAVTMALELRPDIILMDLSMPELDGFEATRQILAHAPDIAVLGYSANSDEQSVRRMQAAGARGFLTKTGDPGDLPTALTRVLAGERFVTIPPDLHPRWPKLD